MTKKKALDNTLHEIKKLVIMNDQKAEQILNLNNEIENYE